MDLLIFIMLVLVGYVAGQLIEKRHYRSIEDRERKFLHLPVVTGRHFLKDEACVEHSNLVTGSVVISVDAFKRFTAGLINFFGGAMVPYETLLDRARREAVLRMKEEAVSADLILNLRIQTASVYKSGANGVGSIEVIAYGTAIILRKEA